MSNGGEPAAIHTSRELISLALIPTLRRNQSIDECITISMNMVEIAKVGGKDSILVIGEVALLGGPIGSRCHSNRSDTSGARL
jgi:hypothetical protein